MRLTNAALEVLQLLFINNRLLREIENIRGINSDNVIRRLLAMSLIKEVGRLETGRPILYGTTNEF